MHACCCSDAGARSERCDAEHNALAEPISHRSFLPITRLATVARPFVHLRLRPPASPAPKGLTRTPFVVARTRDGGCMEKRGPAWDLVAVGLYLSMATVPGR